MKGVFITGSNTEVGKTTVSVEIIKRLREKRPIVVRKPVETDCELVDGALCFQRMPLNSMRPVLLEKV